MEISYLLDTNICIFLLRGNLQIKDKILECGISNCNISEITFAELLYGAYCSSDKDKNIELVKNLCSLFKIIPISDCLEDFVIQKTELRKKGLLIDDFDLLIGATAMAYNLKLITDNIRHFQRLPIEIENWVER